MSSAGVLLAIGLCTACSDGTDLALRVDENGPAPASPDAPGVLTGRPFEDGAPGPAPASGPGTPGPAAGEGSVPPPREPQAPAGEPEPNATETNFFTAGCLSDADCGENRRCELPESDAGALPGPTGEGDAGAGDAGAGPALAPRGRCVAL